MPENYKGDDRRTDSYIDSTMLKQLMNLQEQSLTSFSVVSQKLTEILAIENRIADIINDLKSKSNLNDRDHADVKQQLGQVAQNTFDIINKMNHASNEKIIELIENIEDCNTAFSYKLSNIEVLLKNTEEKIQTLPSMDSSIKNISSGLIDIKNDLLSELKKTTGSFDLIKKALAVISLLIAGTIIASGIWKSIQDHNLNRDIKYMIQEELFKIK